MPPLQFFLQNFHFAESLFASLVFLAVFWLLFDAWRERHERKELFKWLGFLSLAIAFTIHATLVEQHALLLGRSLLGETAELISLALKLIGLGAIAYGMWLDPMPVVPVNEGIVVEKAKKADSKKSTQPALLFSFSPLLLKLAAPLLAASVSLLYYRRARWGLERHLYPVARVFLILTLSEIVGLATLWRGSQNIVLENLTAPFGLFWLLEHSLLLVAVVLLAKWVWQYLLKRLQSQLFMIFTSVVMVIFLATTVSFTYLLLKNLEQDALDNLSTAANVLSYAIRGKEAETLTHAEAFARNSNLKEAMIAKNHETIATAAGTLLATKNEVALTVTSDEGQVLYRSEDPDRWGDSLSSDPLIKRALLGRTSSSVAMREDVLAPTVLLRSVVPVRNEAKQIIGTVLTGIVVDNAFLDGIKNLTGLDAAVYGGNVRSATTFGGPDGKSRWVGIKEETASVQVQVLQKGLQYQGSVSLLNQPYLAVYTPLKDVDNAPVGMIFVGKPQISLLQAAARSIELTFLVAVSLLVLSIIPSYRIARYLAYQLS